MKIIFPLGSSKFPSKGFCIDCLAIPFRVPSWTGKIHPFLYGKYLAEKMRIRLSMRLFLLYLVERLVYSKGFLIYRFIGPDLVIALFILISLVSEMAVDHFTLKYKVMFLPMADFQWCEYDQMCGLPKLVLKNFERHHRTRYWKHIFTSKPTSWLLVGICS